MKKKNIGVKVALSLLGIAVVAGFTFSHFGGFGTGPCADTDEFAKYATGVEDIQVPEHVRIIALGEATHGNAEFQQLKLDVFKQLVEKHEVKAFALEGDFGGCEAANRYIHGGEGTAAEAAAAIGFEIYRTPQMEQTLEWMRSYNESAEVDEDIRFYGYDMQRISYNYQFLLEYADNFGLDTEDLRALRSGDDWSDQYDKAQRLKIIESVKTEFITRDEEATAMAVHCADSLLQNQELAELIDSPDEGPALRDQFMADNTMWILQQEERRGKNTIFICGHNDHMEQFGTFGPGQKVMGTLLADQLQDDYFVIGTDFYHGKVNLRNSNGDRGVYGFYSYDPLAKASKKCGYEMSYLDFGAVPDDSTLQEYISNYSWMGTMGDGYNILMAILPMSYREWRNPSELFDAMIFVSEAHPTEVQPE